MRGAWCVVRMGKMVMTTRSSRWDLVDAGLGWVQQLICRYLGVVVDGLFLTVVLRSGEDVEFSADAGAWSRIVELVLMVSRK